MTISVDDIKKLREMTGAGVADCREALEESGGNLQEAQEYLKAKGIEKAGKKEGRETGVKVVDSYIHSGNTLGSLVVISTETDFVAKTPEFKNLVHEIAMQVASMNPKSVDELLAQEYIRDPKVTIADLIRQAITKFGENIKVEEIERLPK